MEPQEEGRQMTTVTDRDVAKTMQEYGGSFVRALGTAALAADPSNLKKLRDAFQDYWANYARMAEQLSEVEKQASK
jgi:predicted oxidoreductase (fatty acid repression mutant protein)